MILDDNRIDRETCRRLLTREAPPDSWIFIEHDSLEGAVDLTSQVKPDCILLDYHLHDGTGIDYLRALQSNGSTLEYPVVMLTGTGSEIIAVEVMKSGALDYLVKDRLAAEVLHRAVEGAIYRARTARYIASQRQEMERLFREAQEANARKDHFLATLSHELRTPLTPVLAAVEVLDEGVTDPSELKEIAGIIRRNIELEARLIDDMLDLTRISNGKLKVDMNPVDAGEVLRSAIETCRADLTSQKLRVEYQFRATQHKVIGDEARLQQVFWNLLKNAAKFTPEEGTITISTRDAAQGMLEIRVKDTGIGIPEGELENIFLSFEQGGASVTKQFGGLGLGLAICRALVAAHDGKIWAENSAHGPGAEFIVQLKLAEDPATPTSGSAESAEHPLPPDARTVLLVEDHADSAFFFRRIIRKLGYHVVLARTAAQARQLFATYPIDCIVSDIGLPDSTGTDLLKELHAIRPLPAIALSGYGMAEDLQRSRDAGFRIHLIKPIRTAQLTEALTQLMGEEYPS